MKTEQLFNKLSTRLTSILNRNSKSKIERIKDAMQKESMEQQRLRDILAAKQLLQETRSTNKSLRNEIKNLDKPTQQTWKSSKYSGGGGV